MNKPETQQERSIVEFTPFGTKDKIQLSIEIVKRLVAVKTKTGKTASDEDAFRFMLLCQARKLNPFEGDCYLIGYDGHAGPSFSLITAHQAFLKRAELHPEFDGMDSGTIVLRKGEIVDLVGDWHMPEDRILGGWATVWFKGRAHPMKKRLRLERFNKNYGIWRDDPAGMIVKCAEADALRSSFPTMLGGMFIREEAETASGDEIARPVFPENNGGADAPAVQAEIVEEPRKAEEPKPAKKKPSLKRRNPTAPSAPTEQNGREKLTMLLGIGGFKQTDFVQLALDQGWIEIDQGEWEKIPEDRIAEFLRPENWNVVMELFEEHVANPQTERSASSQTKLL